MKIILQTLAFVVFFGQSAAFAHEGHNDITRETAINIAIKSVQQLTFKDFGYEVGKLDKSWKSLSKNDVNISDVLDTGFIISATNSTTQKVIYFEIAKNGKVRGVKYGS
nr:DUF6488 family protein [uncultured Glaciecola sp.]